MKLYISLEIEIFQVQYIIFPILGLFQIELLKFPKLRTKYKVYLIPSQIIIILILSNIIVCFPIINYLSKYEKSKCHSNFKNNSYITLCIL